MSDKTSTIIRPPKEVTKPDHPDRSCLTCDHSYFPTNRATGVVSEGGQCRREPPKVTSFLIPPMVAGDGPRDISVGAWPIVFQNQFCTTGYARKTALTQ